MAPDTPPPQSNPTQITLAGRKLGLLLEVAEEGLSLFQVSLNQLNFAIQQQSIPMTRRNQILIGLWLKAGGSFESSTGVLLVSIHDGCSSPPLL